MKANPITLPYILLERPGSLSYYRKMGLGLHLTRASCFIINLICLLIFSIASEASDTLETGTYCLTETFQARCPKDHVILMEHALFGRMKLGRCITRNFGHLGCSENVLRIFDSRCSGLETCEVTVSDPNLVRTTPCPMDFSSYLEASYQCVKAQQFNLASCDEYPAIHISNLRGYFVSSFMSAYGSNCEVILKVPDGMKLNLTLFDFGIGNGNTSTAPQEIGTICNQYGFISEPRFHREQQLCGDGSRQKVIYTSKTNHVILRLELKGTERFILQYTALGCANLVVVDGTSVKYRGNKAVIMCNVTREESLMLCKNNGWHGRMKNCTRNERKTKEESLQEQDFSMPPVGLSIVIIMGVALVIVVYIAVMVVCVMYIRKCRRRPTQDNEQQPRTAITCNQGQPIYECHLPKTDERVPMLTKFTTLRTNSGEYTGIFEMHNFKPNSDYGKGRAGDHVCNQHSQYGMPEEIYVPRCAGIPSQCQKNPKLSNPKLKDTCTLQEGTPDSFHGFYFEEEQTIDPVGVTTSPDVVSGINEFVDINNIPHVYRPKDSENPYSIHRTECNL